MTAIKFIKLFNIFTFLLIFHQNANCQQANTPNNSNNSRWATPFILTDANTKISFQVDSTWVLVNGSTSGIKGAVSQQPYESSNSRMLLTNISIPVQNMKTGLEMRDSHLYEIMASDKFPDIAVSLSTSDIACNPKILEKVDSCELQQKGQITIRGITREINLNSIIKKLPSGYEASGEIVFPWSAFEIEDPSNFFAKLESDVRVYFALNISR